MKFDFNKYLLIYLVLIVLIDHNIKNIFKIAHKSLTLTNSLLYLFDK